MGVIERARTRVGRGDERGHASAELEKTLRSDPNDTRALLRFAELEAKAGRSVVACETYTRAADLFAHQGFARRALAAFGQALAVARAAALGDRVAPLALAMGRLYVGERLPRDAVTTLDGAARWLIERGRDALALPLLESRVAIDDTEVARVRLAEAFVRLREPERAIEQLGCAFHRLHAQGRRDEALDVAERLIAQRPDAAIARAAAELYLARKRSGDPCLALAKLRICSDAEPTHGPTLELLATAFELAGHPEKAARVRREMMPVPPKPPTPRPTPSLAVAVVAPVRTSAVPPRPSAVPPRPSATPPRPSAIRPRSPSRVNVAEPEALTEESLESEWDELLVEAGVPRFDPGRPSFWLVDDPSAISPDQSGSVVSVSLADVELVDGAPPRSSEPPASLLETALECIDSLFAQGRYEEASVLVLRHLTTRPRNPLLLERQAEIAGMRNAHVEGPPPALFGFPARKAASERAATPTPTPRAIRAS